MPSAVSEPIGALPKPSGLTPDHIGRFRLLRRVGSGGMGVVYEAEDTRDGGRVALKVLLPHAQEEPEGLLRFKREFRALSRLRHKNIVRVMDAGIEDDVAFIVMAFIDGVNVRAHLQQLPLGPAREAALRAVLLQIFSALAHVHARRIIHRDLKPENMLVDAEGLLTIMDFGVARLQRTPTNSPGLLGTFAYMAPEQMLGEEVDGRADLYAVGVFMYEALTGDYPFPVEPPAAALHHHMNTEPEPVLARRPDADPRLAELTMRLLEKDRKKRLANAEAAVAYLNERAPQPALVPRPKTEPGMLFSPRFAGRHAVMERLSTLASDAAASRGRLVLIEGAVGSGKSRLLAEFAQQLRGAEAGFHVLRANCPAEGRQPYAAFTGLLAGVEAICRRSAPELVRRVLGADGALLSAISPRLAELAPEGPGLELDHPQRKLRLHRAVIGVLGRLSLTRPLMLFVEDVHWADTASRELLWDTVRTLLAPRPSAGPGVTVCPVGLVWSRHLLAEGADLSEALIGRIAEQAQLTTVGLAPLEAEEVAEMARSMTGDEHLAADAPLVQDLLRDAQGLPLMVLELMESWVQTGTLSRIEGRWSYHRASEAHAATPQAQIGGPGSDSSDPGRRPQPEDVLRGKIRRLGEDARVILQRLALMGRVLPGRLVSAVSHLEEAALLDAMDELLRSGLIVEEGGRRAVAYRFHHESFRDALVRQQSSRRRRRHHRFIARRVETRFRAQHRELAHLLARHFIGAGCPARAVRYLRMMAEDAGARGDLGAAERRLREAKLILKEAPPGVAAETRRLRLTLAEIDLLLAFGRGKEALARARPEASLRARDPGLMEDELRLRQAESHSALGEVEACLRSLGQMREQPRTRSLSARALLLRGRVYLSLGRFEEADRALVLGLRFAKQIRSCELADRLDERLALVLANKGSHARANKKLLKNLERATRRQEPRRIAWLHGQLGLLRAAQGEEEAALAKLREAVALAEARKLRMELARWLGELGVLLDELGQPEEATRAVERAEQLSTQQGLARLSIRWAGELGAQRLQRGALKEAEEQLRSCLERARALGYRAYEAFSLIQLARLAVVRGEDLAEARADLNEGRAVAEAQHQRALVVTAWRVLGELASAEARPEEAAQARRTAADLAARSHNARLLRARPLPPSV